MTRPEALQCREPREAGDLAVRDWDGEAPPIPGQRAHLRPAGARARPGRARRVVAVNFLGFGASDKPDAYHYSFAQQVGDLAAVVDELGLATVVPVAHDAA